MLELTLLQLKVGRWQVDVLGKALTPCSLSRGEGVNAHLGMGFIDRIRSRILRSLVDASRGSCRSAVHSPKWGWEDRNHGGIAVVERRTRSTSKTTTAMTRSSTCTKESRRRAKAPVNPSQTVIDFTESTEVVEEDATETLITPVPEVGSCPREAAVLEMEKQSWTGDMVRVRVKLLGDTSVRHGKELIEAMGGAMAAKGTAPLMKGGHGILLDLAHAAFWHHAYALFVLPALHGPGMALLAFVTG